MRMLTLLVKLFKGNNSFIARSSKNCFFKKSLMNSLAKNSLPYCLEIIIKDYLAFENKIKIRCTILFKVVAMRKIT